MAVVGFLAASVALSRQKTYIWIVLATAEAISCGW
jgi:hypothetical protein